VRALLDEVERVAPAGADVAFDAQVVEELARLGCRCIEMASGLTAIVDSEEEARRVPSGPSRCG
jgi:hypothetical protein